MVKLAVVRMRGEVKARSEVRETLRMLCLNRVNHCVLIDKTPANEGMLRKAKDMVTWGEIRLEELKSLLLKRGRLAGNKRLTDEHIRSCTEFSSIDEFAKAVHENRANLSAAGLKKVFRLHPPRKGYRATKRPFGNRGSLGYRGEKITDLVTRMI